MALEHGLVTVSRARRYIECLRDRRDYLVEKMAEMEATGRDVSHSFEASEIRALDWVLPIVEAEWDNLARLQRNIGAVENRLKARENRGLGDDLHSLPEWVTA
jgi:uncharacterized coiled-coil protein SlyX